MRAFTTARPSSVRHCTTCTCTRGKGEMKLEQPQSTRLPDTALSQHARHAGRTNTNTDPSLWRLTHLHQCARPVGRVDDQHSVAGVFVVDAHLQAQHDSTALQAALYLCIQTPDAGPPAPHTHWVGAGAAQGPHTPAGCRQRPPRHRLGSACAAAPGLGSDSGTAAGHCCGGLPRYRTCACWLWGCCYCLGVGQAVVLPMLLTVPAKRC